MYGTYCGKHYLKQRNSAPWADQTLYSSWHLRGRGIEINWTGLGRVVRLAKIFKAIISEECWENGHVLPGEELTWQECEMITEI